MLNRVSIFNALSDFISGREHQKKNFTNQQTATDIKLGALGVDSVEQFRLDTNDKIFF